MSQPRKQMTPIHKLFNISTMKFGQLLEYNMRNIFLLAKLRAVKIY